MAIAFVAAGSFATNTTVTTQAIVAPTLQAGDIMLACCYGASTSENIISAPDGTWAEIQQSWNSGTQQHAIFWKLAAGGDSGASFTFSKATDNNLTFGGVISAWRGCAASPLDATAAGKTETTTNTDNVSFPAFNPTATTVEVLFVAFYGTSSTAFSAAMSNDTNPDCTTRFAVQESGLRTITCTSGLNDGSNIAARTWASNSDSDKINTGVVFALVPQSIVPMMMASYRQRRA